MLTVIVGVVPTVVVPLLQLCVKLVPVEVVVPPKVTVGIVQVRVCAVPAVAVGAVLSSFPFPLLVLVHSLDVLVTVKV
ncbi:hypothetical protein [Flavobacterium psychrophilum]|uniref:hypothetical protein n=1 Tax=Flavobacterium psychrophilum TaxID=96345 RepID=UPI00141B0ACD|nr:hypothetical protein [Flavobacterium psychrophilum]